MSAQHRRDPGNYQPHDYDRFKVPTPHEDRERDEEADREQELDDADRRGDMDREGRD